MYRTIWLCDFQVSAYLYLIELTMHGWIETISNGSILIISCDWFSLLKCVDWRKQCECGWCYHAGQRWFCLWNKCYKHCKYQVSKLLYSIVFVSMWWYNIKSHRLSSLPSTFFVLKNIQSGVRVRDQEFAFIITK